MSTVQGSRVEIKTADGVADAYLAHPSGEGPWPAVLFYMDGIGVRPALTAMADRLASHGYYVILPNLYYRGGAYAPFDPAGVFTAGGSERERLMALVRTVDNAGAMRDTSALLDFLDRQPEVNSQPRGAVGYCLGGGLALTAAGTFPSRIGAAASFHGARLITANPDSPHLLIEKMRAKIYVGVAESDHAHTPETMRQLEAALSAAGLRHTIELYPGATHGFAVSDTPVYDREASERHWERLLELFREAIPA